MRAACGALQRWGRGCGTAATTLNVATVLGLTERSQRRDWWRGRGATPAGFCFSRVRDAGGEFTQLVCAGRGAASNAKRDKNVLARLPRESGDGVALQWCDVFREVTCNGTLHGTVQAVHVVAA